MMQLKSNPPRVKTETGHSVPRHYIRKIQQEIYDFKKIYPVNGDEELNLTYMDLLTYGLGFMSYGMVKNKSDEEIEHKDIFHLIDENMEIALVGQKNNAMMEVWRYLDYIMLGISKINIRIYGFEWLWSNNDCSFRVGATISVSTVSPRKIYFTYKNKSRPAFQAIYGQFLSETPTPITIPYNQVIENSTQNHLLEVYVQNHAFTRMKERIDVLPAAFRTVCLNSSLKSCQTVTLHNGQCVIKLLNHETGTIGYLPFTIIVKKLFVLTVLPICNQNVPECKKLQEILGITRKETEYLGMDKLSFFIDTDFEAIPHLKEAVIEARLWHLTELEPLPDYKTQNPMSTANLVHFFQTERTHEEVLKEIEEKY